MKTRFITYKRGQIILMNPKPTIGNELSGMHFAIVLNKNDFPGNGLLTVIPLTSKNKPYYLSLGSFLVDGISGVINEELSKIQNADIKKLSLEEISQQIATLKEIDKQMKHLIGKTDTTYAMPQNIVTISKFKVKRFSKDFNPLKSIRLSNDLFDKLDLEIIKRFTNV